MTKTFTFEATEITEVSQLVDVLSRPYTHITMMQRYVDEVAYMPGVFWKVTRPEIPSSIPNFRSYPPPEYYCASLVVMMDANEHPDTSDLIKEALKKTIE